MSNKLRGTIYVLLCLALWALIPVVAKLGQTSLDHHQFLFWSSLTSFVFIGLYASITGDWKALGTYTNKEWGWLTLLGLLGTYIYYLLLYFGYARATGMEVLVIQYTWPILIVVFSIPLLHERLTLPKAIATLLGFVGVLLVLTKGQFGQININSPLVILLVATGSACFALFSVLSKAVIGKNITKAPTGVVTVYFGVASLAALLSMLALSSFALPTSINEVLAILLNGILVNGLSYVFWMFALKSAEASYLAPFTFITPVLSAIYLIVFFAEPFMAVYGIGLGLVVMGGLINSITTGRKQ